MKNQTLNVAELKARKSQLLTEVAKIETLLEALAAFTDKVPAKSKRREKMSAAARARIGAAKKAWWSNRKKAKA